MKRILSIILLAAMAVSASAQFSKPRREYVEWLLTASKPDRNYKLGEQASLRIEAYKGGKPLDGVKIAYTAGDEMMPPERNDTAVFSNGVATIALGTRTEPGFKACKLSFKVYGKTYKDLVKVGFEPQSLQPLTPMPGDFDTFWRATLSEAEAVELSPEITPLEKYSTEKVEVSLVKINVGPDGRHVYGYLTKPNDGKKHLVLFCPPGAGSNRIEPTTYYSERGYIYLNINIHNGCNPELAEADYQKARKAVEGYNRRGIQSKHSFYYRWVYAACSRCIDFLCTLPEWDGKNVGATGGSQGGALSIVAAALNSKVNFCVPFYPALSDLLGFAKGRAGGWPKYFRNGPEADGAAATLPYYDVANFARKLQCPVFFSFGYNDDTCSPTSTWAVYNSISAPKALAITPTSGHWRYPETNDEAMEWMDSVLGDEQ